MTRLCHCIHVGVSGWRMTRLSHWIRMGVGQLVVRADGQRLVDEAAVALGEVPRQAAVGLSKIWLFSRNPQDYIFSHGFNHEEFENDDNFAVRVH